MFLENFGYRHAGSQLVTDRVLSRDLFRCQTKRFVRTLLRNDNDTVHIADDEVAVLDCDAVDLDRFRDLGYVETARAVCRSSSDSENGKAHFPQRPHVATTAAHNDSPDTFGETCRAQQFSPESTSLVVSRIDHQHITFDHGIDRLHFEFIRFRRNDVDGDGPGGVDSTADAIGACHRLYVRSENLIPIAQGIQNIRDHGGVEFFKSGNSFGHNSVSYWIFGVTTTTRSCILCHTPMKLSSSIFALLVVASVHADESAIRLISGNGGTVNLGNSVPGRIDLTGDDAFSLLRDESGYIVAAAAESGKGRTVGYSHGSFLKSGEMIDQGSVAAFVKNSIRWASRASQPVIGLHPGIANLQSIFEIDDIETEVFPPQELKKHNASVYCAIGHELTDADVETITKFIENGGGFVTSTTPWAFAKQFPDFGKFPPNMILEKSGFRFLPDGYSGRSKSLVIGTPTSQGSPSTSTSSSGGATALIDAILADRNSEKVEDLLKAKALPSRDVPPFLEKLKELNLSVGPIVPTKEEPIIPGSDPLIDTIVELETHFNETVEPGMMYAIPASTDYPGAVDDDAERVTHTFAIDGKYRGWLEGRNAGGWAAKEMRPTGIYAAPGEVITVDLPAKLAGEGFEVVIGSYGGNLNNRDQWHRYPDWQVARPVTSRKTEASSGLGGLVTIRIPREADYGPIEVTIAGGVRAPLYEHGKTDPEKWKNQIRKYPAPWAELASDRMIIAIPSEYIRSLDDPGAVMEVWNGIIESAAELVSVSREDYRAERIVFDRQTAAGSMHSSYPVAAHTGMNAEMAVDARALKSEGNWGFFHEYGHNHQHNLWALPGTGETTCNLWSVYIYENFIGRNRDDTHRAIRPLDRKQRVNSYFSGGSNFEKDWSVWTALEAYLMIQEEFGWEPFQKAFDEYNRLEPDERPKGQQEINDQWVIRLSRACGKNLRSFWAIWGLPMTEKVERELRDLPVWEAHPVTKFAAPKG